jgi:hypothetical protein
MNKNLTITAIFILFGYFIFFLPYTMLFYNSRYEDYIRSNCSLINGTIDTDGILYNFNSIYEVKNCSKEIDICCNHKNYWLDYSKENYTNCYYNKECDIIPEIILDYTLNFLEITSFIAGVFFAISLIYYCENSKKHHYIVIN